MDNGQLRAPQVKVGDRVYFRKYGGAEIKLQGQEFVIIREEEILAVIEG
jgi:chaperonin GroES